MAGSTTKKAVVHRFEKEALAGWVNPVTYVQPAGIELLTAEGNISTVPYIDVKMVAFVRDFQNPGEEPRRTFQTRPKMEGLWVSLQFRDGDILQGVLPNNLLQVEHYGFTIVPPDPFRNQQRIFVPRAALKSVEVLGVVGSPLTKRKPRAAAKEQIGLFEE